MKKTLQFLALATLLTSALVFVHAYTTRQARQPPPVETDPDLTRGLPQRVEAIDLDRPFDFAGEPLPMDNFDVRERLDRELITNSYRHSRTLLNIKLAHKYFPVIEPILARNGVPDDFKYLAVAESDLQNATSYAGAKGVWQFMEAIAEHYGLEVSREVDERYHLEKATQAACEYLLDTKRRFGSWTLAAASYNVGGTRLARELDNQRAESYYDLNLNEETSRYVFRLVAFKEIISRPAEFGFHFDEADLYPPLTGYKIVKVSGAIPHLGDFAREHGTTYRLLKVYNPWLLTSRLSNPQGKTYEIKVPVKEEGGASRQS